MGKWSEDKGTIVGKLFGLTLNTGHAWLSPEKEPRRVLPQKNKEVRS